MYQQLDFLSVPLLLYTVVALEIDISATKEKGELYRQIFSEMERRAYNRPALDAQNDEGRIRNLRLYAQTAATEMRRRGVVSLDGQGAKIVADRLRRLSISEDGIAKAQQAFALSLYTLYGTSGFLHRSFGEFLAAEDVYRFVIEGLDETLTEEEWFELADYFFSGHILTNEVKRFFAYEVDSRSASAEDIAEFLTKKLIHVVIQNGVVTSLADEANDCTLEKIECVVDELMAPHQIHPDHGACAGQRDHRIEGVTVAISSSRTRRSAFPPCAEPRKPIFSRLASEELLFVKLAQLPVLQEQIAGGVFPER